MTQSEAESRNQIQTNIAKFGHHIYLVTGGALPRFAYTIGNKPKLGAELVFAGGALYSGDEVHRILSGIAASLSYKTNWNKFSLQIDDLGLFKLRKVHPSWANGLLLGALHFYPDKTIPAFQIVPDLAHATIDVPDLSAAWSAAAEPIWCWIHESWPYPISSKAVATTNLDALRGKRITEAARWEEDHWELFAGPGPDVPQADFRVVPLATLLGADQSLDAVTSLEVGCAMWRDPVELTWHVWGSQT